MLKLYHEVTGFRHKSCRTEQTQQRKTWSNRNCQRFGHDQRQLTRAWAYWFVDDYGPVDACRRTKKRAFSYCLSHTIQCPPDRNRPGQIWILSSSLRGGEFSEKWVSPKHGSRIRYHNLVYSRNLNGGNHDDPSIHFLCRALVLSSPDLHLSSICMWLNSFSTKLEACEYILDQQVAR